MSEMPSMEEIDNLYAFTEKVFAAATGSAESSQVIEAALADERLARRDILYLGFQMAVAYLARKSEGVGVLVVNRKQSVSGPN